MALKKDSSELIGQKFSRLTITSIYYRDGLKLAQAICECKSEKEYNLNNILRGNTNSCGCKKLENRRYVGDIVGQKFGRLTVTKDLRVKYNRKKILAICECGVEKEFNLQNVVSGITKSCGCLQVETAINLQTTHGLSKHPLFYVWMGMIGRCYGSPKSANFANYGGKGVTVCDEWRASFEAFYDWAIINGYKKGLQIDKDKLSPFKTGLIYSPEFCCFITPRENIRHRSNSVIVEYNDAKKSLPDWCDVLELNYNLVRNRLYKGWSIKEAFETRCLTGVKNRAKLKISKQ